MERKLSEHKIYVTDNYSMFKTMDGNRLLKNDRVNKIVHSINSVGYILSPILVNENMEVVDGQGRLAALERLKLPVHYMVQKGIGVEECQQMNIHQSNWTLLDYIYSHAMRGNCDYQRIQSLCDRFSSLPVSIIISSATDRIMSNPSGKYLQKFKQGSANCTENMYERARWVLDYALKCEQVAKTIGGKKEPFYRALIYAYRNLDSDGRNRLETAVRQHAYDFPALTKVEEYLKRFDGYYNEGLSKPKRIKLSVQWELDTM